MIENIRVEEYTTTEALEQVRTAWATLWARCTYATPFQAPEWLIPWWRHFGEGRLLTLGLWYEERLIGLAPLYLEESDPSKPRTVRLLGTANTDYLDVLLERGREEVALRTIYAYLKKHRDRWDVVDLHHLRPGTPLLESTPPEGWSNATEPQDVCPIVDLSDASDDLEQVVSSGFLKKLHYYRRRAEREGHVRVDQASGDTVEACLDALIELHAARWDERGRPGMLSSPVVQAFHKNAACGLLSRGVLRVYVLRLDGRPLAAYYGFVHRQRAYYYLSGFDPNHDRLSGGHQIVHHALREAIREGAETFDFLRGSEAYKYRWGARDRPIFRRRLQYGSTRIQ